VEQGEVAAMSDIYEVEAGGERFMVYGTSHEEAIAEARRRVNPYAEPCSIPVTVLSVTYFS
jgi:hypothetical protein